MENDLRNWFLSAALPLWSRFGVDYQEGGFFERLNPDLIPTIEPRRARLISRQIYFFSVGGYLGWNGPVDDLLDHGYKFLCTYLVTSSGNVRASCSSQGILIDERQHLYDVAFVLIALAKLFQKNIYAAKVEALALSIVEQLKCHNIGGYIDIVTPSTQCANPHMHLFEAFIAWSSLKTFHQQFWIDRATSIANLAIKFLVIPETGLLPEYFDRNWRPLINSGNFRIEPGHQFEWSWLLQTWALLNGDKAAQNAAFRLCRVAEQKGVDRKRNVVFEAIGDNLLPIDNTARLWQQTERLKAWHLQWSLTGNNEAKRFRDQALSSILQFISGPKSGLWFDEMNEHGVIVLQPVKASTGYHLACAIESLSIN